jgi:hypothetical protein
LHYYLGERFLSHASIVSALGRYRSNEK